MKFKVTRKFDFLMICVYAVMLQVVACMSDVSGLIVIPFLLGVMMMWFFFDMKIIELREDKQK